MDTRKAGLIVFFVVSSCADVSTGSTYSQLETTDMRPRTTKRTLTTMYPDVKDTTTRRASTHTTDTTEDAPESTSSADTLSTSNYATNYTSKETETSVYETSFTSMAPDTTSHQTTDQISTYTTKFPFTETDSASPYTTRGGTSEEHTTVEQPRPCDDVPVPCEELKKYADVTDCRYFFQCFDQVLYRDMCRSDQGFDIYVEDCVIVTPDFNCDERCLSSLSKSVPEPCDDVPVPCEELKKYADVTD